MDRQRSFYEKLSRGQPIAVLVVGDSIGFGSDSSVPERAWASLFSKGLTARYGSAVNLTNLSVGGTDSLFGYAVMRRQAFKDPFDLVVLCHGQNDREETFASRYEALFAQAMADNPGCEMLSVLESSQRAYTPKMEIIRRLAAHYNGAVVDTIAAFAASGQPYESLTTDGVHPNDAGHVLYAQAALGTVERCLRENKAVACRRAYLYPETAQLERFRFVPRHALLRCGLTLSGRTEGRIVAVHCLEGPTLGEPFRVLVDDAVQEEYPLYRDQDWIWERQYVVAQGESCRRKLEIVLQNSNDMDRIVGISEIG